MPGISNEYINGVVNNIVSENNLKECQFSQLNFESIAQNYFGVLIPLVLNGKKNNEAVSLHIVLKLAPTDEQYRVSGALTQFFSREIFAYSIILKKYNILQKGFPIELQYLIPQCYYVCKEYCNEAIAMQNMSVNGYKPYTNKRYLDFDHVTVSLKSLAKFHALSFIMKERDRELYEKSLKVCLPLSAANNKRFMDILQDRLDKALIKLENTKYVPMLETLKQNLNDNIESASNNVQRICICHGDIWKENILYKYEDNRPISACLIDYQTVRTISPAYDALYLIISSTNSELRHQHYGELLTVYYEMFATVLKEAGLNPDFLYSKDMFYSDLKTVGPACFIVANTALWLSNGLQKEGHVRSKTPWNTKEEEIDAVNSYKLAIVGIIEDFIKYGYLYL
ncbi:uncharacterized protein LOC106131508 isoform X1 [Amyelois transitella]|uniref:uncharacterized protein LOC106131508 isoform X1 n=1 Tax=Amyelois transitella TaxID=680683 RepID=UPI00298F99BB|nr:uncharacterized protein LOC106131508 isoform X1 [Amyelois transitella]